MGLVLLWWLTVTLIGLITCPIAFAVLRYLPDKGYVLSKVLGLLLTGYLCWILGYLFFNLGTIWLSLLIVLGLSAVLVLFWLHGHVFEFLKKNLGYVLVVEVFFLMAFLIAGAYKMRTFEIAGTEKPMDFAMINGILSSPSMPPQDPWLSGGSISYYYFGYFIVAMLCRLTGVASGEAYNLAVALAWALAAVSAFSVAYALTKRFRYSFFSMACLVLFGNLDYWHRAIQSFQVGDLRAPYYNQAPDANVPSGLSGFFSFLFSPLQHSWDYFQASRIIQVAPGDKLINEFPSFSFFLSDLHPHMMAIPLVLLAIALAFNQLKAPAEGLAALGSQPMGRILQWVVLSLVLGALGFANSWDFPTQVALLGVCFCLQQYWAGEKADLRTWLVPALVVVGTAAAASFIFYMPFYLRFQSQAQGLGLVHDRTDLYYFFVIFGAFLILILPALWDRFFLGDEKAGKSKAKRSEESECVICGKKETNGKKFCGNCGGEFISPSASEAKALAVEPVAGWGEAFKAWINPVKDHAKPLLLLLGLAIVALGLNFGPVELGTVFFCLFFIVLGVWGLMVQDGNKEMAFSVLMVLAALGLIVMCEFIFLKDHFSTSDLYRMNTVFKFHYQAWILLSLAAGPFLKYLVENLWARWAVWKRVLWSSMAGLAFLGAGLYPVLALESRLAGSSVDASTMDGSAFYQQVFPADYDAIQWIKANVKPVGGKVPVILEAWGGSYQQEYGRIATNTGYPTVLGWDFHEAQWRGSWDKPAIRGGDDQDTILKRQADVDTIYTSPDLNQTRQLLQEYRIDYVYVGNSERQKYKDHASNFSKFYQLGTVVWSENSGNPDAAVLFKVNSF